MDSSHPHVGKWCRETLWVVEDSPEAALFLGTDRVLEHANSSARSLACLVAGGPAEPEQLLAVIPGSAWAALDTDDGSWRGRLATMPIPLFCALRRVEGDPDRIIVTMYEDTSTHGHYDLQHRHQALDNAFRQLASAQEQLLHSEKMASIGQLAAGVAHEINNPIGYVHSNLGALDEYLDTLMALLEGYDRVIAENVPQAGRDELAALRDRLDIDYIVKDMPHLLTESSEGIERVIRIVQDLKELSHTNRSDSMEPSDLVAGLESTLNIVWNELKYKVRLEKHLAPLPLVECNLPEINQVFMNLLINAGQAIEHQGVLTLGAGVEGKDVWISITDSGTGIPEDVLPRILDPFFTTKAVGKGTGLGLAIANRIIGKHHGRLQISSQVGVGSTFRIVLPMVQPPPATIAVA